MNRYILIISICCLNLFSCQSRYEKSNKIVKDSATIDAGLCIPEIRDLNHKKLTIALYPSAMPYYIDMKSKCAENNLNEIKRAIRLNIPVRAKVFKDNNYEIAKILPATEAEIDHNKKSRIKPRIKPLSYYFQY